MPDTLHIYRCLQRRKYAGVMMNTRNSKTVIFCEKNLPILHGNENVSHKTYICNHAVCVIVLQIHLPFLWYCLCHMLFCILLAKLSECNKCLFYVFTGFSWTCVEVCCSSIDFAKTLAVLTLFSCDQYFCLNDLFKESRTVLFRTKILTKSITSHDLVSLWHILI